MATPLPPKTSASKAPLASPQQKILVVAYSLYVLVLFALAARHEPWFDEAQAWLLARDHSLWELIAVKARYEGSPVLWHALLKGLIAAGLDYARLGLVPANFAALAGWLLFFRSPFPWALRILLPWTYFLFYQYGIVARSYALMAPLLFSVASVKTWHERPARFFGALLLLASLSVHGYLIATGILIAYLYETARAPDRRCRLRAMAWGYAAFTALTVALFFMLRPAPDYRFPAHGYPWDQVPGIWRQALGGSLAEDRWLTPVAALALVAFTYRHRTLPYLLGPASLLLGLFAVRYVNVWHHGTLWLVMVFAAWRAFLAREARPPGSAAPADGWSARARAFLRSPIDASFQVTLACVAAVQIGWSARTAALDWQEPYCGSQELATYLREQGLADRTFVGIGMRSVALLPYFDRNLFLNFNHGRRPAAWSWSTSNPYTEDAAEIQRLNPELIVIGHYQLDQEPPPEIPGYVHAGRFDGTLYWKGQGWEGNWFDLLRRADQP